MLFQTAVHLKTAGHSRKKKYDLEEKKYDNGERRTDMKKESTKEKSSQVKTKNTTVKTKIRYGERTYGRKKVRNEA